MEPHPWQQTTKPNQRGQSLPLAFPQDRGKTNRPLAVPLIAGSASKGEPEEIHEKKRASHRNASFTAAVARADSPSFESIATAASGHCRLKLGPPDPNDTRPRLCRFEDGAEYVVVV